MINKILRRIVLLSVLFSACAFAQEYPPVRQQKLNSPEFVQDRLVFRFDAGYASEVKLAGTWLESPRLMQKMPGGIWEFHTTGLTSGLYSYHFIVDGVITNDRNNALSYLDGSEVENYFVIDGANVERFKPVSRKGTIRKTSYWSSSLKSTRNVTVYLPHGYDPESEDTRYPAMYLLHDEGGNNDSWVSAGMLPLIMDKLIASGKAVPMVIVMPDCSGVDSDSRLMNSIVNELIPFVERNFPVIPSETKRCIAGVSAGGRLALEAAIKYYNRFDYICPMSCGVEDSSHLIDDLLRVKKSKIRLMWVGCGRFDNVAYPSSKLLHDKLSYVHLDHSFYLSSGGHDWGSWRQYLHTFTPLLFKYYTDD